MDFYQIMSTEGRKDKLDLSAGFVVGRSKDLMIRGGFYAVWDEAAGMWSTDEYDVGRLIDADLAEYARTHEGPFTVRYMRNYNSKAWTTWRNYVTSVGDSFHELDQTLTFQNQPVKRTDYVSRRLPYALEPGDCSAWDELVGTLYSVEERRKIEWAIGSVVAGDSKKIQKFLVFYGRPGAGKGTILNIIDKLFEGYTAKFDAKSLGSNNGTFATDAFRSNPLVAIQQDGDLSRIDDNTRLNSVVSHEEIMMNEKYKASYTGKVNAMLFLGTNQPVKISDAKSGIIRRLIDVNPTNVMIPVNHYNTLISRVDFELGAIAHHCLQVYLSMGKNYYNSYRPMEMMFQTDIIFNYVEAYFEEFKRANGVSLKQAYAWYKEYCSETGVERPLPQYKLREELRNYFDDFKDRHEIGGVTHRSYYVGFIADRFKTPVVLKEEIFSLVVDDTVSLLDEMLAEQPAQYSNEAGIPSMAWSKVTTTLAEIETHQEHYVRVPQDHIVIDFDLKGDDGGKALERNLEAASSWPPTYAELSKSGQGVHLHYVYDGDVADLAPVFSDGIEVKVFTGKSSLRRRVSKCNSVPVATIKNGLPLKERSKVLTADTIRSERGLRELIGRNLRKEIHPGTKSSIDFIAKILADAYTSGLDFDVTDLRPKIIAFANNSTNQAFVCLKTVQGMRFASDAIPAIPSPRLPDSSENPRVFFDVEVFPNLFVVCWVGDEGDNVTKMINPSPQDIEGLMSMRLVGFNNRRYDNHILYARYLGYSNEQLYGLSQKLISNAGNATFAAAYSLSYTDVWDFSSVKQTLKKFEIELGFKHLELDLPWDEPVPEELWLKVADYCANDVIATRGTFMAREQDFVARQILAELSGLTVNDPTAKHTAAIIFEGNRTPSNEFVYTDLSKEFPGYEFDMGKSTFKGETLGEGGYVYAEPGMYSNVALLDVASMHPTSIIKLNMFGKYTPNFKGLMDARLAIKGGRYKDARTMMGGKLAPYLKDEAGAKALSDALKIVINIVYGLTSATFDSPFRDKRNRDNIGAKRGALFMVELKNAVQAQGYKVVHIKTDSIKIADADDKIIAFVHEFGQNYGYNFEHENTYEKFCLVNDAVYVARTGPPEKMEWTAVGTQFKVPYVFKTLFTGDVVQPKDLAETKQVTKGAMYLKFAGETRFVGRTGRFIPVTEDCGMGGTLVRKDGDKEHAVTGTKGYLWVEAEAVKFDDIEVDMRYFEGLRDAAIATINKFGSYKKFVS